MPRGRDVAHQSLDGHRGNVVQIPFPQRHLDGRFLDVKRIEVHRDQNHVVAGGKGLAIKNDLVVVRGVEAQD